MESTSEYIRIKRFLKSSGVAFESEITDIIDRVAQMFLMLMLSR